jgi:hypothetical protein
MSEDSEKILSESLHAMAHDIKDRDAKIERLRALVDAKDLLLSEWLGEEKAQSEIERLRADRDSWADQADARVKDCVEYLSEIERLREIERGWLKANASGGWIDDLRKTVEQVDELKAEVERLRSELGHCIHLDNHNAIVRNRNAEIEQLSGVIDRAAKAWLSIEGIAWEGDLGAAMEAAVEDIKRMRNTIATWERACVSYVEVLRIQDADIKRLRELLVEWLEPPENGGAEATNLAESFEQRVKEAVGYG